MFSEKAKQEKAKQGLRRAVVITTTALFLIMGMTVGNLTTVKAEEEKTPAEKAGEAVVTGAKAGFIDTNGDGVPDMAPEGGGGTVQDGYPIASNADSDSWEATLYINGNRKGSIMLYGPRTLPNVGDDGGFLKRMDWGDSLGNKNSTSTQGGYKKKQRVDGMPWGDQSGREGFMKDIDKVNKGILTPLRDAGKMTKAERDKIVAQEKYLEAHKDITKEEIAEKLKSGEFCEWLISCEPLNIIHWKGATKPGSSKKGAYNYDIDKRQEMYNNWKTRHSG